MRSLLAGRKPVVVSAPASVSRHMGVLRKLPLVPNLGLLVFLFSYCCLVRCQLSCSQRTPGIQFLGCRSWTASVSRWDGSSRLTWTSVPLTLSAATIPDVIGPVSSPPPPQEQARDQEGPTRFSGTQERTLRLVVCHPIPLNLPCEGAGCICMRRF